MKQIRDAKTIFSRAVAAVQPRTLVPQSLGLAGGKLLVHRKPFPLRKPCHLVGFGKAVFGMAMEVERILGDNLQGGILSIPQGFDAEFEEVDDDEDDEEPTEEGVSGEVEEAARRMWKEFEEKLKGQGLMVEDEDQGLRKDHRKQVEDQRMKKIDDLLLWKQDEVKPQSSDEDNSGYELSRKKTVMRLDEEVLRQRLLNKFEVFEGAKDNLPDEASLRAAQSIKQFCEKLAQDDLLLVLVSGGGSALLPLPVPGCSLAEKQDIVRALSQRGADIRELNAVRKKLSQLKGGGLAKASSPARTIALILSDVVGDPLGFIASGPTVPNLDPPGRAKEICEKYNIAISAEIRNILQTETATFNDFSHVENFVIGSNTLACQAAKSAAQNLGYPTLILTNKIRGNVEDLSEFYANLAQNLAKFRQRICVISGGEPTVSVSGGGTGGRNQHLALAFSHKARQLGLQKTVFLSCGTDGIDGPTDAAGAVATPDMGQGVEGWLRNHDSYNFFKDYQGGEFLVKTGHTGTNVMDIHILIIEN